jgi:hypothetical protein
MHLAPIRVTPTFKDNASRNVNAGPGGFRYIPAGKVVLARIGDFIPYKAYDFQEPEFTDNHRAIMHSLTNYRRRRALKSVHAGGYTSASTYGGRDPHRAIDTLQRLWDDDGSTRLISFDIETLGSPFSKVDQSAYQLFTPTEIAMRAYTRNQHGQYVASGDLFNAFVKPDDTTLGHLETLVGRLSEAGKTGKLNALKLTETEHRTIVDLMRYSQLTDEKYFAGTGLDAGSRVAAEFAYSPRLGMTGVSRHHGMFSARVNVAGRETLFSDQLARASVQDLYRLIGHAESGLGMLKSEEHAVGIDRVLEAIQTIMPELEKEGAILIGANQTRFDAAAIREALRKRHGDTIADAFNLPQNQLDVFQLLSAAYQDTNKLHVDAYASRLMKTGKFASFDEARNVAKRELFSMPRASRISYEMESLAETMLGEQYQHAAMSDVDMPVTVINMLQEPLSGKLADAEDMPLAYLDELTYLSHDKYAIHKGDTIFASRAYFAGEHDPYSFRYENVRRQVRDEAGNVKIVTEKVKTYGDQVVNKRGIYQVRGLWQTSTTIDNEAAQLFGATLYDPTTRQTSYISALTETELADKMQTFAINLSAAERLGQIDRTVIPKLTAEDRARRMYENMFDISGKSSARQSSGIGLAKKLYTTAKAAEEAGYNRLTPEMRTLLEEHGISTPAQQRNFMQLMPRLTSEADTMLDAIEYIESKQPANASLVFSMLNERLDPLETSLGKYGLNARTTRIWSPGADSLTSIDLSSIDSATASLYGVVGSAVKQRKVGFISPAHQDATRRAVLTNILDKMVQTPAEDGAARLLTSSEYTSIMQHQDTSQRINALAAILANKPDSMLMPDQQITSLAPRMAFTIAGEQLDQQGIHRVIDDIAANVSSSTMLYSQGPKIQSSVSMQLLGKLKDERATGKYPKLSAMNDQQLKQVTDFAAEIYTTLAVNKAGGKKTGGLFKVLEDGQLQMVLFNSDHTSSVLRAAATGKHTSQAIGIDMPMLNEHGQWVIGGMRRQAQQVLSVTGRSSDPYALQSLPDIMASEIRMRSATIKDAVELGQLDRAHSIIKMAQSSATQRLAGYTAYMRASDIDAGIPKVGTNFNNFIANRTIVVDELIRDPNYGIPRLRHMTFDRYNKSTWPMIDPEEMVEWFTGEHGLQAFVRDYGKELGIEDLHPESLRSSGVIAGKVSTVNVRDLWTFGEYTKLTRENLIQAGSYYALSDDAVQQADSLGFRPRSVTLTRTRLMAELESSGVDLSAIPKDITLEQLVQRPEVAAVLDSNALHTPGVSVHALILNDAQIETVRQHSIGKLQQELKTATGDEAARLTSVLGELQGWDTNILRPSTFEQQGIPRADLEPLFGAYGEKRYAINAADVSDEFQPYLEQFFAEGRPVDVDVAGKKMLLAESTRYGKEKVPTYFTETHGGPVKLVDVEVNDGTYSLQFAYGLPGGPTAKYGAEAEKFTSGAGMSKEAFQYMFGDDVGLVYMTRPTKRQDFGATLTGMYNYAAETAIASGDEGIKQFQALSQKHLGFTPEPIVDGGHIRFIQPEKVTLPDDGPNIISRMLSVYDEMGIEPTKSLAGGAVQARREVIELRRMIQDEHYYTADMYGRGRGMAFGAREFGALERQGLLYEQSDIPYSRPTAIKRWLDDALDLGSNREAVQAQAKGHYLSLKHIMSGDSGTLSQSLGVSQLRLAAGGQYSYTPADLSGTVFDRALYADPTTGRLDPTRGFWLDLGDTVDIDTGKRHDMQSVSRIWVGPQQLTETSEGLLMFDETHKRLNRVVEAAEALRVTKLQMPDDIDQDAMKHLVEHGDSELLRTVAAGDARGAHSVLTQRVNEYVQSFTQDISSSQSTFAKLGVGGRLPMSGNLQAKLISPTIWQDVVEKGIPAGEASMVDPLVAFISTDTMREMMGEFADEMVSAADGTQMTALDMVRNQGIMGLVERYPNIHQKTIAPMEFRILDDLPSNAIYMSPLAGMHLFNADQDGDRIAFAMAVNKNLKPGSMDFAAVQEQLRAGKQRIVGGQGHFSYLNVDTMLGLLGKEFQEGKLSDAAMPSIDNLKDAEIVNFARRAGEHELEVATRLGKQQTGSLSNLSLKLRGFGAEYYLGEAHRLGGDVADEAVMRNVDQWSMVEALGRMMEQDTLTPKHQTAGDYLATVKQLRDAFSGTQRDRATARASALDAIDKLWGGLDNAAEASQLYITGTTTPAHTVEEMLDAAFNMMDAHPAEWHAAYTKIGVSGGPMARSDRNIGDVWQALQTDPNLAPLHNLRITQETLGIEPSGADYRQRAPQGHYRRILDDAQEQAKEQARQQAKRGLEGVLDEAQEGAKRPFREAMDDILGQGMGAKIKSGLGIGAMIATLGLAARVVATRDKELPPSEDSDQAPPVTAPSNERVARVAEGPPRGLSVRVRARGKMQGHEAAYQVNNAIQAGMPFDLNTHVSVTDNTNKLDDNYLQKLFARAL